MTNPHLDDETVAAFLDGTVPAAERTHVLQRLASDPDAYAAFLEASQVAAAARDQVDAAPPTSRTQRGRWQRRLTFAGPFLAAAGIAGAVFVARSSSGPDVITFAQEATRPPVSGPGSLVAAFGPNWDVPGWPVVRGTDAPATAGTAARLGARLVQLEAAVRGSDTVATHAAVAAIVDLASSVEGAGAAARQLSTPEGLGSGERQRIARQLRSSTGETAAFDAGTWLESARLAIVWSDPAFLAADGRAYTILAGIVNALEARSLGAPWTSTLGSMRVLVAERPLTPAAAAPLVRAALEALPR